MRLSILAAGTALALVPAIALAQAPASSANTPAAQTGNQNAAQNSAAALRGHMRQMLQSSGFTDIRIMPSSFMIHAKDGGGNPVVMSVSPDSITEVAEVGAANGNGTNGVAANEEAGTTASSDTSQFVSIANSDRLSSNLVGLDVYNSSNQDIGQIKDIAFGPKGRAQAYIMSVGGFLGMGEHYVAVNPNDVKVSYNTSDSKWHASANATAAELKAAPEFKYNGRWNASKS